VRAAIYVRVSTEKVSQKDSPEHQLGACRAFCEKEGLEVVRVYEDRSSGTSIVGRPDVQRLIRDAQRDAFDAVVFTALSRFSRNAYDAIALKNTLYNVLRKRIVSIEDQYDSAARDDDLIFIIISGMNQKLSEQISVASRRGIRQSALRGNFTGSVAPYGYRKTTGVDGRKTLEVDEEAARVVRLIFDLYANRKLGEKQIVDYLNSPDVAIPSPRRRGPWGVTTVQRILQNEAYIGRNVFGKYTNVLHYNRIDNLHDRRKRLVRRDEALWERTDRPTHEPIVDEATFRKAQDVRRLRGGGKRGGRKAFANAFAKSMFCKHCGSAIVAAASKGTYRYLMCSRRRRAGAAGCVNGRWLPYDEVRDRVVRWLGERLGERYDPEAVASAVWEAVRSRLAVSAEVERELAQCERRLSEARTLLFELRKRRMLGELDEAQYGFEKERYERDIERWAAEAASAREELRRVETDAETRAALRAAAAEAAAFDRWADASALRLAVLPFVERITVDADGTVDVYTPLA